MMSSSINNTKQKSKYINYTKFAPYLMIAPTLIGLTIFNFYPFFLAIYKSLFEWSGSFIEGYGVNKFIGLKNYIELFHDEIFWQSWRNVFFFIITGVIVNFTFPFINALLIYSVRKSNYSFYLRVLYIAPLVVPTIVVFLLWGFLYDPNIGLIGRIAEITQINGGFIDLLGNIKSVKWGIRFMGFPWVGGIVLLIYLAGLSAIDKSLHEAAKIDGASTLQRIFKIDIPLCANQFKMVFILTVIGEIQDFVKIKVITDGGPGYSSYVPGLYMYKLAFGNSDYGKANAMGVTMLIVMLTISIFSNKIFKKVDE